MLSLPLIYILYIKIHILNVVCAKSNSGAKTHLGVVQIPLTTNIKGELQEYAHNVWIAEKC